MANEVGDQQSLQQSLARVQDALAKQQPPPRRPARAPAEDQVCAIGHDAGRDHASSDFMMMGSRRRPGHDSHPRSIRRCRRGLAQPYVAGLHRRGESQIYVSRGTGFWGPPLRVFAPVEITLLRLQPA